MRLLPHQCAICYQDILNCLGHFAKLIKQVADLVSRKILTHVPRLSSLSMHRHYNVKR